MLGASTDDDAEAPTAAPGVAGGSPADAADSATCAFAEGGAAVSPFGIRIWRSDAEVGGVCCAGRVGGAESAGRKAAARLDVTPSDGSNT
ncbi:MAG: hypothetical protein RML99_12655 [Anaerolineae bacterium]|nr:hypothetical protein [Anaerolineae bacterium]